MVLPHTMSRSSSRVRSVGAPAAAVIAGTLALTACSPADGEAPTAEASPVAADVEQLRVLASFYPLVYAVEQVGGELVDVASLTPAGAEPHDPEISPAQLREMSQADAVVYLSGFQPAIDDAITSRQPENVLDVAEVADLQPAPDEHSHDDEHGHEDEHAGEDDGHGHGGLDPHFWLDPLRLAAVGEEIAAVLAQTDPDNAETFTANAEAFTSDLMALDEELSAGLAQCERDVVITGHTAFGYLAERYGFTEIGIAGIDPESEPSPARLREIAEEVRVHGVTAVYTESAASPAVADTLASDLGLEVLVLDPVETQADPSTDYRGVMESNLAALRTGLGCE